METLFEEITKKKPERNIFLETDSEILNAEQGESCDKSQVGHESRDSSGNIVICTRNGNGSYTWQKGRS